MLRIVTFYLFWMLRIVRKKQSYFVFFLMPNPNFRFLNPLVYGDYPDIMKKNAGTRIPTFTKLESRKVKGSFDFLGLNHYFTAQVKDMPISLQTDRRDFLADMAVMIKCM